MENSVPVRYAAEVANWFGRRRRALGLAAALFVFAGVAPARVWAQRVEVVSPGRLGRPAVDPSLLQRLEAVAPHVQTFGAIAADLDRDGDLDLLATTSDELIAVWVNTGLGRFTREPLRPRSSLTTSATLADAGAAAQAPAVPTGPRVDPCPVESPRPSPAAAIGDALSPFDSASIDRPTPIIPGRAPPPRPHLT